MAVLVLNAGSSTLKVSLFESSQLKEPKPSAPKWTQTFSWSGKVDEARKVFNSFAKELSPISTVGHRVVHGGDRLNAPTLITPEVKKIIKELFPLAPLHNPLNLLGIELAEQTFPKALQVAVFDTAFHSGMPPEAKNYPLPKEWRDQGIQRYGFHGINHEYCAHQCASLLGKELALLKIATCHIGNGVSLTAVKGGKSLFTTMGFTPCEGVMMGTRCGSIDPVIPLFLARQGKSVEELDSGMNKQAGLQGICQTREMKEILERHDENAKLALKMYLHSLKYHLGGIIAVLEGVDAIVFSGGVGENAPKVREEVANAFAYLGIKLDGEKNNLGKEGEIVHSDSVIKLLVIKAREDWAIASAALRTTDEHR